MKEQKREWLNRGKKLLSETAGKLKKILKPPKNRYLAIGALVAFFYAAGLLAQILNDRGRWLPGQELHLPSLNPFRCFAMLFTSYGATAILGLFLFLVIAALFFWMNKEDRTGMVYDKERKFWYSDKGVYGTAGWMNSQELQKCFDLTPVEKAGEVEEIIYGVKDGMVVSRKAGSFLGPHIAVFGSSGSMKSRTIGRGMVIACAKQGRSLVVTDPKAELASDTIEYLKSYGYEVKILNVVDPYNSHRYNALEGIEERPIFLHNIVEAIIANTGGGVGDPIYDQAEGALLTALILLQFEREDIEYPTIKGAYEVLLETSGQEELDLYFSGCASGSRAKRAYNLFSKAGEKLKGNICLGLGVRLSIMQNEEIADLMCGSDMDLLALGQRKTAYFLVLNDQDNSTRFVAATFFSLLFLRLVQYADREAPGRTLPVPVTLLLDEFCSIVGSLGGYPQKLSNIRSRGIQVCQICQSLGQLMNRFPDYLWSEILGNIDTVICLGCSSDQVTAKFISDRSGEVTIYADTVMKQRNIYTPSILQPNYRHSEGTGRRMLLTPDEVMRLPANEMLVMVNHEQLLKLEKFDYTRNPESKKFRPVSIKGLPIVPQSAAVPVDEAMAILEQTPQKQETERREPEPVPQPAMPPIPKPARKRRKKAEKEVLGEGEQIRFDGYLFEPGPAQAEKPEFPTEGAENAPGEVRKISKPNV